jgi:hypothetical protein
MVAKTEIEKQRPTTHDADSFTHSLYDRPSTMKDIRLHLIVAGERQPILSFVNVASFSSDLECPSAASRGTKRSFFKTASSNNQRKRSKSAQPTSATELFAKTPLRANAGNSRASKSTHKKSVRFNDVHIKEYARTLGDFDDNGMSLDYALALSDDKHSPPSMTTLALEVYEQSKTSAYKCPRDYDDHGRLDAVQRCVLLTQSMDLSELAQQISLRNGTTTGRAISKVENDLQRFLKAPSTKLLPVIPKKKA